MEKNIYPSYSVYIQKGGQLKKAVPRHRLRRAQIFDLNEARIAAAHCWNRYKGQLDVLVLRYDAPYKATIVALINKEEKEQLWEDTLKVQNS